MTINRMPLEEVEGYFHEGLLTPVEAVAWLSDLGRTPDDLQEFTPVPKFQVGDKVIFTNDYGVVFPDKTIVEVDIDESLGYPVFRYFYSPHDAPWYGAREHNFQLSTFLLT